MQITTIHLGLLPAARNTMYSALVNDGRTSYADTDAAGLCRKVRRFARFILLQPGGVVVVSPAVEHRDALACVIEQLYQNDLDESPALAFCSTVSRLFIPRTVVYSSYDGLRAGYAPCPFCDHYRRTGDAYNARHPQMHGMVIGRIERQVSA